MIGTLLKLCIVMIDGAQSRNNVCHYGIHYIVLDNLFPGKSCCARCVLWYNMHETYSMSHRLYWRFCFVLFCCNYSIVPCDRYTHIRQDLCLLNKSYVKIHINFQIFSKQWVSIADTEWLLTKCFLAAWWLADALAIGSHSQAFRERLFYPRPVLAFGYCHRLRLWVCVSVCVCQSRACPHDNSSLVQARFTKFGPEMQNTLV